MQSYLILFFLWTLFYAMHSLMAASATKDWIGRVLPVLVRPYRVLYNGISLVLFALAFLYQKNIQEQLLFQSALISYIGLTLILVSFFLMHAAFKSYRLGEFVGLNQWRNNSFHAALSDKFQRGGLNRFVRHPLYSASYLFLFAYFLFKPMTGTAIFTLTGCIYLYVGAKWEEKKLIKQFGEEYEKYQKEVPMFFPF